MVVQKVQLLLVFASLLLVASVLAVPNVERPTHVPVLSGPYAEELVACKHQWSTIATDGPKVSRCMETFVWALGIRLRDPEGLPVLGIESLDPLFLASVPLEDSATLKGRMVNLTVFDSYKSLTPRSTRIIYDPETKVATVYIRAKQIRGDSGYELLVNMAGLFDPSSTSEGTFTSGSASAKVFDVKTKIKLHMKPRRSGGLVVSKVETDTDFADYELDLAPTRPDDPVGNLLKTLLSNKETALSLTKEMMLPVFNKELAKRVGLLFYQGWQKLEQI